MTIVTVSRGTFSGGQALAEGVAQRLGYRCVGREEIIAAATWYGVPAEELTEAKERVPSFWRRLTCERIAYLDGVRAALCEQARDGNLVVHGFVMQLLLPGVSHVLRVRAIADMEYRIEAASRERSLKREEAISYIQRIDMERREWVRFLYGVEWDDSSLYDVVLNLSHIGLEGGCEAVAHLARLEQFRPTPGSLRAMEDLAVSSRVSAALRRDDRTSGADLKIIAQHGVVTVSGISGSAALKDAVQTVVGEIRGVAELRNEIQVRLPVLS